MRLLRSDGLKIREEFGPSSAAQILGYMVGGKRRAIAPLNRKVWWLIYTLEWLSSGPRVSPREL